MVTQRGEQVSQPMAKKLSSVLGIDIGSQRIKICEVRSQGREPVVTAVGVIDTPEGAVDHSGIYNPDAVGAALKQLLSQSGATSSAAVVSIAGQQSVLVRTLEVPKMNPAELREHMQWEINRNIPFAESNIVSDFKPLGNDDPNSPNMDVVMAISPQSAIDTVIQCVKKAGRSVAAIDVEPLSLARSLQTSYDDELQGKTVCLVDMGAKTSSINIFGGSKLLMPRQIPMGGEMFTKSIADAYTISLPEAEAMKVERLEIPESAADLAATAVADPFAVSGGATQEFQPYNPFADDTFGGGYGAPAANPFAEPANPFADAFPQAEGYGTDAQSAAVEPEPIAPPPVDATPAIPENSEAMRMYQAIAPVLDEFVSEIRRSIDYYRSRGGSVDRILLCGGGCNLRGLPFFLSKMLGVPCDAYDPLRRLNVNVRKVAPAFVDEHRQELAVAVGNGLHIFFD